MRADPLAPAAEPPSAPPSSARTAPSIASARRVIEHEVRALGILDAALDGPLGQTFAIAIETILALRGRLMVTGVGKSGHIGRKIAATLASTGTPASFVHASEASHGDLGMITPADAVLALSWSGESAELRDVIDYCHRFAVPLVAFTSRADSALGRAASVPLVLPQAPEACPMGLAPTSSTTMQLALGDALGVALLESRGFTASDFGRFHPGGKLGAGLKRIAEIMHRDDRIPVTRTGTPLAEAIIELSRKGFGCVAVTDEGGALRGIVTDGDLGRHMAADLMTRTVDAIMSPDPITVSADTLLSEALAILEMRKVSALLVVDEAHPIGIVHLHDLLRAGVA